MVWSLIPIKSKIYTLVVDWITNQQLCHITTIHVSPIATAHRVWFNTTVAPRLKKP